MSKLVDMIIYGKQVMFSFVFQMLQLLVEAKMMLTMMGMMKKMMMTMMTMRILSSPMRKDRKARKRVQSEVTRLLLTQMMS